MGDYTVYDLGELFINPYEHPKWVYPHRRAEVARNYFAWELMHGSDIEDLKKSPYWKYYEEETPCQDAKM